MKMWASIPAAAEEAGGPPAFFPAGGAAIFLRPKWRAIVTAAERPRALKDPVGFRPSSLMTTPGYSRLRSMGVKPSPRVTGGASGRTASYRHIVGARGNSDEREKVFLIVARS